MRAGKVAGVQLILNNWFLALLLLFALAGLLGKLVLVFSAIMWHEIAHAATARMLGLKVREIELLPFGGVARIDGLSETGPRKDLLIAAAGPASSLLLASIIWLLMMRVPLYEEILRFFLQVNIMLVLFNLVPALPLDGGRILRALLCQLWDYKQATRVVVCIGKMISAILLVVSVGMFVFDGTINVTFIAAGVFLFIASRTESVTAGFQMMQTLSRKKELLMTRGLLPTVQYTALGTIMAKDVVRLFRPEHYHIVLVVDDDLTVKGRLTETELLQAITDKGLYTKIKTILE